MQRLCSGLLALLVVSAPLAARAQTPPPQVPPSAAPPAPMPPPAPYDPYAPQPAYGAPPPPYGAPVYAAPPYGYAPYGQPTPMQLMTYENEKKSPALALVLSLWIPGVGNIYADHAAGAAITWAGIIGGCVLMGVGVNQDVKDLNGQSTTSGSGDGLILAGVVAFLGFYIYGVVDAYQSANEYNADLARKLRLPMMNLSVVPVRTSGQTTAVAPTLTWRF
jgi:hypothetical protein